MSIAYYNEHDPYAAAWLRELIKQKVIPYGYVDERSIEDVRPSDLIGFSQHHFFAGIGGWAEALRLAGWPDDCPVWTGSCPCQPFSAAGKGKGAADERHLWPAWFHLIEQCQPAKLFGEQVDAAIKHGWLDLVQTDLEALGYAFGAAIVPAAGVGAPHGRHRVWFVADSPQGGLGINGGASRTGGHAAQCDATSVVGNTFDAGLERLAGHGDARFERQDQTGSVAEAGATSGVEHATGERRRKAGRLSARSSQRATHAGTTSGFWANADWIPCRDGKWRSIEPGTFPLAHGIPARMGRLRGYGNAIVPQVAAEFITAYLTRGG